MTADQDLSAPKRWNMYASTPTIAEKTKWTSIEVEEDGDWVLYADHERAVQAAVANAVESSDKALRDALAYIDKGHNGMARNIIAAAIRSRGVAG